MDVKSWIQALPKAEYHLHLEGAIPWQLVREVSPESLPEMPFWAASNYRYKDFVEFQEALRDCSRPVIVDIEGYQRVAEFNLLRLKEENCLYVEMSVGLGGIIKRGINCADLLQALQMIVPDGMVVAWIIGLGRQYSFTDEQLADALATPLLAGIDIAGDERGDNTERFIEIYAEAQQRGLRTKAHAGEQLDSDFIHKTLDNLQPLRLQHGIRGAGDKNLLKRLVDEQISLDLCPSSNLMLKVVPDLATYPIRAFLDAGVDFTINTDDPAMFCCTLSKELHLMLEHKLMTPREIAVMQYRAFEKARMSKDAIASAQAKIAELLEIPL